MNNQYQTIAKTFYAIVDSGYVKPDFFEEKTKAFIEAGVKIIQLRAKHETHAQRRELAAKMLPYFENYRGEGAKPVLIINDDLELAQYVCAQIPNAGMHVGQDDFSPSDVRQILGKDAVIGLSTHSIEQAKGAIALPEGILSYFAVGPVYATKTKPGRAAVGLTLVEEVAKLAPKLDWYAIGGINENTAKAVKDAGAKRFVAVSDVLIPKDTVGAVSRLVQKFLS